jgi:hypothetical protein
MAHRWRSPAVAFVRDISQRLLARKLLARKEREGVTVVTTTDERDDEGKIFEVAVVRGLEHIGPGVMKCNDAYYFHPALISRICAGRSDDFKTLIHDVLSIAVQHALDLDGVPQASITLEVAEVR